MTPDALAGVLSPASAFPVLSPLDWEALLAQARCASLVSALAWRWRAAGRLADVPAGPRWQLEAALRVSERLAADMALEIDRVDQALGRAGLRCVLLKGAAYLAAGLAPARGRVFGDIDILVPKASLPAAENALLGAGWISSDLDPYNQRYYREWMHEIPPLSHVHRGSVIDVHHTITPPTSTFHVDGAALLAQAQPVPGRPNLWVLQAEDMLLHSAVHLFADGEFEHGLRDLLDMHRLLLQFAAQDPDFWPRLLARARQLGLTVPLHHALLHVERLLGPVVPAACQAEAHALRPPWLRRRLMAALLTQVLRPDHASARQALTSLARQALYLRAHWLRMPPRLLLPHLLRKAWMRQFPARKPAPPDA